MELTQVCHVIRMESIKEIAKPAAVKTAYFFFDITEYSISARIWALLYVAQPMAPKINRTIDNSDISCAPIIGKLKK
jgi:hypothetical protein